MPKGQQVPDPAEPVPEPQPTPAPQPEPTPEAEPMNDAARAELDRRKGAA